MTRARVFPPLLALAMSAAAFALEPMGYSGREALSAGSAQGGVAGNADQCAKLAREIEDLKGKPLRRSAAADRYAVECKGESPRPAHQGSLQ
jgi:hypothetical protein